MSELPNHAKVVIIGGGAVGASVLYHLAEMGWTDCLLVEKNELTSGSTWHAAGNCPTFSGSLNVMQLQLHSNQLYKKLAEDDNYPINYHRTGSLRLAQSRERRQEFAHVAAMANQSGIDMALMSPQEARDAYYPEMEIHDLDAVLWDPMDGDIDPAQLTQALASAARAKGQQIARFCEVTGLNQRPDQSWDVTTTKGTVHAEFVVNAAGYFAPVIGRMVGRDIPSVVMAHQYLVTESIPALESRAGQLPLLRDPDDSYYLRQERDGLILGPYEWQATPHWQDGLPDDFAFQLYPDDLDRLEWYIEQACARVPMLAEGGVQKVINGPIPYAPDGLPLVGPAPGLTNFFEACVFTFGITQAGGAGKIMAEILVNGEPELDMWMLDPRRYTDYTTKSYCEAKAIEVYQNEYAMHFPHKEWPLGRPCKMSPTYQRLKEKGAQFGARNGWERAVWFAGPDDTPEPDLTWGVPHFEAAIQREVDAVHNRAAVLDLTGFARFHVTGEGAHAWLDGMISGTVPKPGRIALAYFCSERGTVVTELTISCLEENDFWLIGPAAGEWHDQDWLIQHLPTDGSVACENITQAFGCLVIAGPESRAILSTLTDTDISDSAVPWLRHAWTEIDGARGLLIRVNFVGELGYELHMPMDNMLAVYDRLMEAGSVAGIADFGLYAMDALRLEKSYRNWKQDLSSEYTPIQSAMDRFVRLNKPDFLGKEALTKEREQGSTLRFAAFEVASDTAIPPYGAPIMVDGSRSGLITSGGKGYRIGKTLALGYVKPAHAEPGTKVVIPVFGEEIAATVIEESPFDPQNSRLMG